MKTLDEVIKAMEYCTEIDDYGCECCPGFEEPDCYVHKDALHYLKAYRDDKDELTALRAFWAEQQANPALTWQELQQMEGKSVWVKGIVGFWAFIVETECAEREIMPRITCLDCTTDRRFNLYKGEYGTTWQAYRKERK